MTFTSQSPLVNIPLQGLPIAAAALDASGVIIAPNHRFVRLCGGTGSTTVRQHLAEVVSQRYRAAVEEGLHTLTALDHQSTQSCRIKALRAKSPSLWLAIDVVPLGPGAVVPYLACAQAIAARRRSDNPPRPHQVTCLRTRSAVVPLMADTNSWPPLLMTLSHEFRGPLTAIRGWAQLATRGALPPATMSRALTLISRNAATLSAMIENLFDLSRRAAGSLVLNRDAIDLNSLAELVVESALPAANEHDVVLSAQATNGPLLVHGDPVRLEQVVRNLVDNAIKFTPRGGHVQVHTAGDGLFAELVVSDDGRGIAPDLLPVIFEPFRHFDPTVRPSDKGLGLGLALVRELVQLHGGDVRALSNGEGQGSTFIVRLPTVNAAMAVGEGDHRVCSGDAPEIVRSVAESVKTGGGRPELPDLSPGDGSQTKVALIGAIRAAVEAIHRKSPGEVEGFKAWLASVAAKVSLASNEGGFLGFGGTLVSSEEE